MAATNGQANAHDRRSVIHAAAISEFSSRGFASTSMANIADAAGMSRPALYQYFHNKADIFESAFAALIDDCVDRALAALVEPGPISVQLDRFLQRFDGDLWERMAESPHSQEILNAKHAHASHVFEQAAQRLRKGLAAHLRRIGTPNRRRAEWMDLLELSPKGFKTDQPSVATYRRRLGALARSVGADIEHEA
jgi:AcrR family transcriptional regulator